MKTNFCSLVIAVSSLFLSSNGYAQKVNYAGSMSEMGKENFAPHIRLDTLAQKKHLFGLGPLGRMQGEITILDGKPFGVSVNPSGEGIVSVNWKIEAPFFVYAYVEKWKSFTLKADINNLADLQQAVAEIAKKNGYDLAQPFPFRLVGTFARLTTHIVMPRSEKVAGYQTK